MTKFRIRKLALLFVACLSGACSTTSREISEPALLSDLKPIAKVDERFQSYNVEMVEVTGGRFWAPYGGPKGEMHRMRPPTNLADIRLRAMAKNLGPAYVRVSGTWANSTYLPKEGERVSAPPPGFSQVLSRDQWRGVVAFAKAVDAKIVTSFPGSPGARDPDGSWNPEQAQRLIELTRDAGGTIHSAELFNEPTIPPYGALPKGYNAVDHTRDFRIFHAWAKKAVPELKLAGPGGTAEGTMMKHSPESEAQGFLQSRDLMAAIPGALDIVTYHYYGNVSQRCGSLPGLKEEALSADWLDRTLIDAEFYAVLRDQYAPGKPLWLNETAQAACGGSPWAATFVDSFRYVNQLGVLAQRSVQVVAHNTLAASDYALIDYDSMMPRPNYWAAYLWAKTMGSTVLDAPLSPSPDIRLYAHCLRRHKGGVGLVAINVGTETQSIMVGQRANVWVMTAPSLDSKVVTINGNTPIVDAKGNINGDISVIANGSLSLSGKAIAFIAQPNARNAACYR